MKPNALLQDVVTDLRAMSEAFLPGVGGDSGLPVMMKYPGSDDTHGENSGEVKKLGGVDDADQGPQLTDV